MLSITYNLFLMILSTVHNIYGIDITILRTFKCETDLDTSF